MNVRTPGLPLMLLAALGLSSVASAQQRVEFQRQKFDRSRFERPGQPAAPAPAPAPAAEPVGSFAPAAPAPMPTEAPAPPPAAGGSSVFSYSNAPATAWGSAPAPAASTNSAIFSADAPPLSGPPPATYPPGATPEEKAAIDSPLFDQVPSKWFNNAKDYEELVALQKKTGACMLVYFKNPSVPNEKGLCSWFEKSITTDIDWRKAMKYFIKLEITLPGPSAVRELVDLYKVSRTPAIFVVKPGSTLLARLMVFEYPTGGRPQPIAVPVVLEALKSRCNPAYQTLF